MIKLDENYTIDSDSCNWILRYERTYDGKDKLGNPKEQTSTEESFHANFKQCILKYINETSKWCDDLTAILDKLNEVDIKLDKLNFTKDDL